MPTFVRSLRRAALAGTVCVAGASVVAPALRAQATPADSITYFEFQVDKPANVAPGVFHLVYPPALRARGVGGDVLVQFVVDAQGRADVRSFKVLAAADTGFVPAVREAVAGAQFIPAEIGGRKVRQLVQMPFQFRPPPPPPVTDSTRRVPRAPGAPPS